MRISNFIIALVFKLLSTSNLLWHSFLMYNIWHNLCLYFHMHWHDTYKKLYIYIRIFRITTNIQQFEIFSFLKTLLIIWFPLWLFIYMSISRQEIFVIRISPLSISRTISWKLRFRVIQVIFYLTIDSW